MFDFQIYKTVVKSNNVNQLERLISLFNAGPFKFKDNASVIFELTLSMLGMTTEYLRGSDP